MSKFTMSVDMDGGAFDGSVDDAGLELLKIMGKASGRVRDGEREGTLLDTNGNTVGSWAIVPNDPS